jgi:hypothetical protein
MTTFKEKVQPSAVVFDAHEEAVLLYWKYLDYARMRLIRILRFARLILSDKVCSPPADRISFFLNRNFVCQMEDPLSVFALLLLIRMSESVAGSKYP